MRLLAVIAACATVLAVSAGAAVGAPPASESWAKPQIEAVVGAGLMAPSVAEFRPDDPLTRGELSELLGALKSSVAVAGDPAAPVTIADLNAALVRHLGLGDAEKQFRRGLVAAGLAPPKRAGTEIVAHMLGLRTNHGNEALEPSPGDPATRAEAAFSVARVLNLAGSWNVLDVRRKAESFSLPALGDWQRRILARAVRFLGYPYVFAGSSEHPQTLYSGDVPAGFDCSGFVWRVFKLEPFDGAPQLAATLKGRTTYAMSGEVPPALRIGRDALQPADVVFFGDQGPSSKPAQIGHMGIYLGNGWFIHSSSGGGGVMISALSGWYDERFAWARRPLAEAGLDGAAAAEPVPAGDAEASSEPETPEPTTIP